jgi:hypothetical protein
VPRKEIVIVEKLKIGSKHRQVLIATVEHKAEGLKFGALVILQ